MALVSTSSGSGAAAPTPRPSARCRTSATLSFPFPSSCRTSPRYDRAPHRRRAKHTQGGRRDVRERYVAVAVGPIPKAVRATLDSILAEQPGIGGAYPFPRAVDGTRPISDEFVSKWLRQAERGRSSRSSGDRSGTPTAGSGHGAQGAPGPGRGGGRWVEGHSDAATDLPAARSRDALPRRDGATELREAKA